MTQFSGDAWNYDYIAELGGTGIRKTGRKLNKPHVGKLLKELD